MSLNGLDDAKVKEAHDAAVAEPGGWFLLKYATRDEIVLLGRGNGGIVEIRNAIANYEEASPLFGFLRYRRRNVIIKYVPEDCSRLVQARATVHFTAVTERFSPHDTVFPISTSRELRDTILSAACSLHTASGSTSSSTSSLRRRRLMEIAEDAEEDIRAKRQSTVPEERPPTAKSSSITGQAIPESSSPPDFPTGMTPSTSYRSMASDLTSVDSGGSELTTRSLARASDEPRKSSQSTRPDIYRYSSYGSNGKPKIKLGPRPSLDVGGRPHTSASSHYRPVSTLPAGLKIFSSNISKSKKARPKSQYPPETPSMTLSPPAIPENSESPQAQVRPHTSDGRPNTSSGASIKPLMSANVNIPKLPIMTPEKARLMKAMELRKKQKQRSEVPPPPVQPAPEESLSLPASDGLKSPTIQDNRLSGAPQEVHVTLAMLNDMTKEDDSGIAFDASSMLKTDESDATRSDSYPVSPVGPSERAESTRASSISESTDETIQEGQLSKPFIGDDKKPSNESPRNASILTSPHDHTENTTAIEQPDLAGLPHLLLTTYQPPPSPISVPQIYRATTPVEESLAASELPETTEQIKAIPDNLADVELSEAKATHAERTLESANILESQGNIPETPQTVLVPEIVPQPPSPAKAPVREWKVPRSKFTVQNLHAEANAPSAPQEPLPIPATQNSLSAALPSPVGSSFSIGTRRSNTEEEQEQGTTSNKRLRRKAMVEPIKTDLELTDRSAANSDAHFSSDDDLMDELQSAVFQEAQPISVSKSPIGPVFPSPKKKEQNRFSRAFSSPMRKDSLSSQRLSPPNKLEPLRSVSASSAYLNRISLQSSKPMASKVNLGSGISQRIKALEKLSSLAPGAIETSGTNAPSSSSPAFFTVRKSVRASRSPSIAERANSLNQNTPSPRESPDSSPEAFKLRERSSSIKSRVDAFSARPIHTIQPTSRPESISVTARIIRDPNQPFPTKPELGKDSSDFTPLDLKQSPLVIDHQKAISTPTKQTIQERRLSNSSKTSKTATTTRERRSSITVVRDLINQGRASLSEHRRSITLEPSTASSVVLSPSRPPSTHATSPSVNRALSISSRRSTPSRDIGGSFSPPPTARSATSLSDEQENKSNRASRMLRRMSSSFSSSKKNIAHAMSPTVREESEPFTSTSRDSSHPSLSSNGQAVSSVNIGDVNVQFPDTLLWKRRSMLLDSQGYLIVSSALTAHGNDRKKANTGAMRRYHLSSFRTPSIPDVEMQELPNSVVLDFVEGGGLQIACEDRGGQARVLNILQDAHRTWAAFGQ